MIWSDLLGCVLWKNIVQRNKEFKKIKIIVPSAKPSESDEWHITYVTYLKPNVVGTYLLSSLFLNVVSSLALKRILYNSTALCFFRRESIWCGSVIYWPWPKEIFKTCNVLPFSCTHLALSIDKAKNPRITQNTRLLQISLPWSWTLHHVQKYQMYFPNVFHTVSPKPGLFFKWKIQCVTQRNRTN